MGLKKFSDKFIDKDKIVFCIGEKGIVLTIFKKNKLTSRVFAKSGSVEEITPINELMSTEPDLPVSIIIDTAEQVFNRQTLPAVSHFTVNNILKKKLQRAFPEENLKAYKLIGKSNDATNEWQYFLISAIPTNYLNSWLEILLNYPNPLNSVNSMITEFFCLKQNLVKILDKEKNKKLTQKDHWELLICHHKVGGFRQVAFKEDKIIFSRLIVTGEGESVDFLAGNIEQETANSLEYLQRLGYKKTDLLSLYLVVSSEIKSKLKNSKFKTDNVFFFTPFELATQLKLENAALNEDKFSDIVIAANFVKYGAVLALENKLTKQLVNYKNLRIWAKFPSKILLPIFIIYNLFISIEIFTAQKNVDLLLDEKVAAINELDKYKKIAERQKDKIRMLQLVNIYKKLIGNYQTPFNCFEKIKASMNQSITIESIEWKYLDQSNIKRRNNQNDITAIFKVNVQNQNAAYNQLFDDVDKFIRDVTAAFSGYNIDYNRTNEKLNFAQDIKLIPLQLTISGPKKSPKSLTVNE